MRDEGCWRPERELQLKQRGHRCVAQLLAHLQPCSSLSILRGRGEAVVKERQARF